MSPCRPPRRCAPLATRLQNATSGSPGSVGFRVSGFPWISDFELRISHGISVLLDELLDELFKLHFVPPPAGNGRGLRSRANRVANPASDAGEAGQDRVGQAEGVVNHAATGNGHAIESRGDVVAGRSTNDVGGVQAGWFKPKDTPAIHLELQRLMVGGAQKVRPGRGAGVAGATPRIVEGELEAREMGTPRFPIVSPRVRA